ncbi:MAG: formylglycine-generating enzyme family protein [Acidobacteriota bacterium]|nr:formylglycine-generating enzyme family protein [Acidobacteriota bacterium]
MSDSGHPGPEAATGRADLLRAWLDGDDAGLEQMAELLGYERRPQRPSEDLSQPDLASVLALEEKSRANLAPTPAPQSWRPIPFWRVTAVEWREKIGDEAEKERREKAQSRDREAVELLREQDFEPVPLARGETPPEPLSIAPWPRLRRRLDQELRTIQRRREVDVDALVQRWARGEVVQRMPRRRGLFHERVALILDGSSRLGPFHTDQLRLAATLVRWLGMDRLRLLPPPGHSTPTMMPGEVVLAVSDLGTYGGAGVRAEWERYGRSLRSQGARLRALVPCPAARWPVGAFELWNAIDWSAPERPRRRRRALPTQEMGSAATHEEESSEPDRLESLPASSSAEAATSFGEPLGKDSKLLQSLLAALSPALRVEPELLREIRHALGPEADLALEAEVWAHPHVQGAESGILAVRPEQSPRLQRRFAELDGDTKAAVALAILHWHRLLPPEILHVEIAHLQAAGVPKEVLGRERVAAAETWFRRSALTLRQIAPQGSAVGAGLDAFAQRHARKAPAALWSLPGYREALVSTVRLLRQRHSDFQLPAGATPEMLDGDDGPPPERKLTLWQEPGRLRVLPFGTPGQGSPLVNLLAREPRISVGMEDQPPRELDFDAEDPSLGWPKPVSTLEIVTDVHRVHLNAGHRPEWAVAAGRDRYGFWAAFEVEGQKKQVAQQRMRWIPPGRFWMGSPESEEGRYGDDEGPRHLVELSEGFWLAETPCTQELWEAVMEKNPSEYRSARRPVDSVSWEDCQKFCVQLKKKRRKLSCRLPTEAEWEYACRAGTETATWVGDLEILGERNAPLLDDIGWYGGNSGKNFDLEEGLDSSNWKEKQYEHTRAGTREVGLKDPNPWGLYDMLGNVYEWCSDHWQNRYDAKPQVNPLGPEEGADRVYRGGSWFSHAQDVRAAYRVWYHPGFRRLNLGFRLALGQGRGAPAAEPLGEFGRGQGRTGA